MRRWWWGQRNRPGSMSVGSPTWASGWERQHPVGTACWPRPGRRWRDGFGVLRRSAAGPSSSQGPRDVPGRAARRPALAAEIRPLPRVVRPSIELTVTIAGLRELRRRNGIAARHTRARPTRLSSSSADQISSPISSKIAVREIGPGDVPSSSCPPSSTPQPWLPRVHAGPIRHVHRRAHPDGRPGKVVRDELASSRSMSAAATLVALGREPFGTGPARCPAWRRSPGLSHAAETS